MVTPDHAPSEQRLPRRSQVSKAGGEGSDEGRLGQEAGGRRGNRTGRNKRAGRGGAGRQGATPPVFWSACNLITRDSRPPPCVEAVTGSARDALGTPGLARIGHDTSLSIIFYVIL